MRTVIQRVKSANVKYSCDGAEVINSINKGFQILLGITHDDSLKDLEYIIEKIVGLRVFEDDEGKMNLSIKEVGGEVLLVSQFTLYGDARKGKRPSFTDAARPDYAIPLYEKAIEMIKSNGLICETGKFGAEMEVTIVNDGPVTILLDSKKLF